MAENETMDIQAAIEHLSDTHPAEAKHLHNASCRDVIALGVDESYALRNTEGEIRCYKSSLTLSAANHGLVKIQDQYTISAQGYEFWAEAVGASVIFPASVVVDGKRIGNPHVVKDNGKTVSVYARAIAFRFSGKGIPMVSDWTTILDLRIYKMIDFLAKTKKFPQAFQFLPNDMPPIEIEGYTGNATWAEYPFDESTKLWFNTSHPEALKWLGTILNREKKAVDYAQTFAARNARKHLSGLQKPPKNANTWTMVVYSWRPIHGQMIKWDSSKYLQLQDQIESRIHGEDVQVETGTERVEEDQTQIAMEETIDPEDKPETDEPAEITEEDKEDAIDVNGQVQVQAEETEPEPEVEALDAREARLDAMPDQYSDADKKVVESYEKAKDFFRDDHYPAACKELNLNPSAKHTVNEMEVINFTINNMV